jgi:hypothetical protein
MSTNKTEHYGLHAWEAGDDFLRTEFNENFAILDALAVAGSYQGDDQGSQDIQLGFRPRLVIITQQDGYMTGGSGTLGGIFPDSGYSGKKCNILDDGFRVWSESTTHMDDSYYTFYYIAFR